jgi:hypothetical protein
MVSESNGYDEMNQLQAIFDICGTPGNATVLTLRHLLPDTALTLR